MQFEIKNALRTSLTETTVGGVNYVVFTIIPVVGVVGNPYKGFINSENTITVKCLRSMTGDQMNDAVNSACSVFLAETFPNI